MENSTGIKDEFLKRWLLTTLPGLQSILEDIKGLGFSRQANACEECVSEMSRVSKVRRKKQKRDNMDMININYATVFTNSN